MNEQAKAQISWLAYRLWAEAGKPEGRSLEFWLEAERQYISQVSGPLVGGNLPAE